MTAIDDHWPSLPPIRTSSSNSRVSCETLNLHTPPPASLSADTRTFVITPPSASHWVRPTSKSADASPRYSQPSSPSHGFSCCFGHKSSRGHGHDRGRRGGAQGSFDAPGLLRSIFGFSSPMVSYASGASPSNWQSPQSNWQTPPSLTSSPSGRTSPINSLRPGVATPHAGVLLRNSKGHTAHVHAFTMMPSDVVGKKKPPGYESDEPTSPEVTCIGKVRRKHCKATWDASVKEKQKDAKKKGKGKKMPQRSEAHRSLSFQGIPTDFDIHTPTHKDLTKDDDAISSQALTESSNGDAHTYSTDFPGCDSPFSCAQSQSGMLETQSNLQGERIVGANHEDFEGSLCDQKAGSGTPTAVSETPPPPNCLLLMKKGSRNRSAHYCSDEQALHEPTVQQWNFGQVLT